MCFRYFQTIDSDGFFANARRENKKQTRSRTSGCFFFFFFSNTHDANADGRRAVERIRFFFFSFFFNFFSLLSRDHSSHPLQLCVEREKDRVLEIKPEIERSYA